ncbi:right-handed parallel beta-helix repeat-containing protein [Sulfolobus sp. B1]|uniref:right-handed parallel beta-helix repeat-containing protein n=1 Tax=Sulfolobus sp. B1 TaxID=2200888 RepID=UPI00163DAD9F|nr:right-handed parallel beta-helix repeat-containing protein [Sulfolobus sp. B1]
MRRKVVSFILLLLIIVPILVSPNILAGSISSNSIIIVKKNNVIIEGMKIIGNITVINSHNVLIYNNTIFGSEYYGIFVYNSSNVSIIDNKIGSNYYDGISIKQSNNTVIERNIIFNNTNGDGITIWYFSNNIFISNNSIIENKYGIVLLTSLNIVVKNNIITNSMYYGIYLYNVSNTSLYDNLVEEDDAGIEIEYSSVVNVLSNHISNNLVGVYLGKEIYNLTLRYNVIQSAKFVGLLIVYYPIPFVSQGNTFYNNTKNQFYAFNTTINSITPSYSITNITIRQQQRSGQNTFYYLIPLSLILSLLIVLLVKRKKG